MTLVSCDFDVCLQKDAKLEITHCAGRLPSPNTMSTLQLCGVTALFGIILEANKHQILMGLRNTTNPVLKWKITIENDHQGSLSVRGQLQSNMLFTKTGSHQT